jgi:hypothetical protein
MAPKFMTVPLRAFAAASRSGGTYRGRRVRAAGQPSEDTPVAPREHIEHGDARAAGGVDREQEPDRRHAELDAHDHPHALDDVGHRTADDRGDQQRPELDEADQADRERRVRLRVDLDRDRDVEDVRADHAQALADDQPAELPRRAERREVERDPGHQTMRSSATPTPPNVATR